MSGTPSAISGHLNAQQCYRSVPWIEFGLLMKAHYLLLGHENVMVTVVDSIYRQYYTRFNLLALRYQLF